MPLFVALTQYKPEEQIPVTKEHMALWTAIVQRKLPEGVELCAYYTTGAQRAFMVWKAPGKEDLEKFFEQYAPVIKKSTELVPVVQGYPPTMEFDLGLLGALIMMASK